MKKYPLILISCLLLAATGCGNDEPTATTETTVPTETTQAVTETTVLTTKATTVTVPETTEKAMEVTMDNINEMFSFDFPTQNSEKYNLFFLYCFYNKPEEMDLKTVLYHGISDDDNDNITEISDEEILSAGLSPEIIESIPAVKIESDRMNDYLLKKTGLTADEFENTDMKVKYVEKYDAYYGIMATDTILQPVEFISVEMNDDIYTAVYTTKDYITYSDSDITCEVKFKVNDGVLQFISNKQIETEE